MIVQYVQHVQRPDLPRARGLLVLAISDDQLL